MPREVLDVTNLAKVPLLDLTRESEQVRDELRAAFERVLTSGRYIMGPEVEQIEAELQAFLGIRHAIGVSSGTDALLLALMALGIGPGDEVICPTYTFFATAGAIWRVGARPVFVDIDPMTYNCDPDQVAARLSTRTKAIMPVHLFGQSAAMDPILECASRRGVPVIEDAAQAIGAIYGDRPAGGMGTMGCFSFYPSKNLGCLGDGGLLTTHDDNLAQLCRALRVHGSKKTYEHFVVGGNFRLDALQAAFLRVRLGHLSADTERRRQNAALYRRMFRDSDVVRTGGEPDSYAMLTLPHEVEPSHTYNQFVIRVHGEGRRDDLRTWLRERCVATEVYYPVPMHLQGCFSSLGYRLGDFPIAELAAKETLALPIFPGLVPEEIARVVGLVASWCRADTA
jgi:dTDP-4-amino-4,6-dideoxygalactose transaminase